MSSAARAGSVRPTSRKIYQGRARKSDSAETSDTAAELQEGAKEGRGKEEVEGEDEDEEDEEYLLCKNGEK